MNIQSIFDAVADATRRRILALLADQGELCVCELTAALDDLQPRISRHLAVLKDAGVVIPRRDATWMYYRLADALPTWAASLCEALPQGAVPEFEADLQRLRAMSGRPQRYPRRIASADFPARARLTQPT